MEAVLHLLKHQKLVGKDGYVLGADISKILLDLAKRNYSNIGKFRNLNIAMFKTIVLKKIFLVKLFLDLELCFSKVQY